ncbi:MAG: pyrroline-5-carboxylate reductase [Chloroflexota bacterium]|nr:pyrroline-5-carboxylate reductase [Chloroflexota bacterium]
MTKPKKLREKAATAETSPLASTRIAFVGAGVMAESIIAGLLAKGMLPADHIVGSHPRSERRDQLEERFGIATTPGNRESVDGADLVVLTIKPQALKPVMQQLHGRLNPRQTVISIIAGANLASLRRGLGHDGIVRVMPNTPAQISEGMSVWRATDEVSGDQRTAVRALLGALGEEIEVDTEKYVDMATALSGTGPTYVFLMMEALIDAGVHMGFPRHLAEEIVLQTVSGSVAFARSSGKHMAELRNMVTSPGGTSADAIYQMEKGGLRTVLSKSVYAAYTRTQSLAAEQDRDEG